MAFQLRRGTAAGWASSNPILASGELVMDITNNILKLGDGVTHYNTLPTYGTGPTGATGPAGPKGQIVLNFGALPGLNEASVVVSDVNILGTSLPSAEFAAVATADHTISDHTYAPLFIELTCGAPVAGVGFTIYATCSDKISGTFNINYFWS